MGRGVKELRLEDMTKEELIELCRQMCFPRPCSRNLAMIRTYVMAREANKLAKSRSPLKLKKAEALVERIQELSLKHGFWKEKRIKE